MSTGQQRGRSRQRRFHFVPGQRLWQDLPLSGRFNIQSRIMLDPFVEQQIPVEMTQRGKLAPHAAPVDLVRKQLLQEFTHVVAPRSQQKSLRLFQELRELEYV